MISVLTFSNVSADDFSVVIPMTFTNEPSLPTQNYANVTIIGAMASGEVSYTVDALTPPFTAGTNFGIQRFGFNSDLVITSGQFALPSGWSLTTDQNLSQFGVFDYVVSGTGSTRQDPLSFTISGLASSDVTLSHFNILNNSGFIVQAHIADFTAVEGAGELGFTSAQFGGVPEVPFGVLRVRYMWKILGFT